ncbi:hypothetical protein CBR_g34560 [Chara braunii]|uniref:Uncharacterized protein n=1 Tax=Chara braunii TaxID=69332 RepID=A0A388LIX5_CHABU|nr:hypothetical protein CBR_g34560 [Chara braunii]|eukprot:GBG82276.1 hypothetical protein CBR_g34560 [Chara braunii]
MSWLDRMQMRFEETGRDTSLLLQETSWFMENQVNAVGNNVRKLCSESSWFVENQVNTVSNSVRKLCSEFVRELLVPTGASPSPCAAPHDESPVKISPPASTGQVVWHPASNIDKLTTEKKVCASQTALSSAALQSNQAAETPAAAPSQGQAFKERDERAQQTAKNLRRRHSKGVADKKKENSQGEDVVLGRPVDCLPLRMSSCEKKVELSAGREEIKKEAVRGLSEQQIVKRVEEESMMEVIALPQTMDSNDRVVELEGPVVKLSAEMSKGAAGLMAVEESNPGFSDAVEELLDDTSAAGLTGQSSPESLSLPGSTDAPVVVGNPDTCRQGGITKTTRSESEIDLELLSESEFEIAQGQWYAESDTESVDRKRLGMGRSASAISLESRRSETGNDFTDWELV